MGVFWTKPLCSIEFRPDGVSSRQRSAAVRTRYYRQFLGFFKFFQPILNPVIQSCIERCRGIAIPTAVFTAQLLNMHALEAVSYAKHDYRNPRSWDCPNPI